MAYRIFALLWTAALVVAGCSSSNPPKRSSTPAGGQVWVQRYAGATGRPAQGQSLAVSRDGATVFVTGNSGTVAYTAATGARLWQQAPGAFRGGGGLSAAPTLAASPDGATVYVSGSDGSDYLTVAYVAATGATRWTARYDGPAKKEDVARAVVVSPDGRMVFVNGTSTGPAGLDYATVAYDAASGARRWAVRHGGPVSNEAAMFGAGSHSMAVEGDALFVTGVTTHRGTGLDYATVAYAAASGTQRWAARFNGSGGREDLATAVAAGGGVVAVTGGSTSASSGLDAVTVGYDARTGEQRWVARYDGPAGKNDGGTSVGISRSGTVYVTGTSEGREVSTEDYLTLAYTAATGKRAWEARYSGPGEADDNALALAVSETSVYVTGRSHGAGSGVDYATVAYAADGTRLWVARYASSGTGDDEAQAVAVSPNGARVFVTGGSAGRSGPEYATVAYRA